MPRTPPTQPTEAELLILQAIWRIGPATVRQVRDALASTRPLAYTSVQTLMTIMLRKKILKRRMVNGAGVFSAVVSENVTNGSMLRDLLDRVFRGSPTKLVNQLLDAGELDATELRALQKLVNDNLKSADDRSGAASENSKSKRS